MFNRVQSCSVLCGYLDERVGVKHEVGAGLEVSQGAQHVCLLQQDRLVPLEYGQGEPEENLRALKEEAVPDPQLGLKHRDVPSCFVPFCIFPEVVKLPFCSNISEKVNI